MMGKRFDKYLHNLWHVLHPNQECDDAGEMLVITDTGLQQQMVFDAFSADSRGAAAFLSGLPPMSPDVIDMEQRAHEARMEAIVPVMPLLMGQATFMGHVAAVLHLHKTTEELTEEQVELVHQVFTNIVKASVVASVSTAVSLGVLEIAKEVTSDVR